MAEKKNLMTQEGKQKLEDELQDLIHVQRPAITKKIAEAREQGDLSENAEYDAAMDEQGKIEDRIKDIQEILKNVQVVDDDGSGTINIGYTVKLVDDDGEEDEYRIVGSNEVDILNGKISNESPVGAAIIGHVAGGTVTVETEAGAFSYRIVDAHRTKDK